MTTTPSPALMAHRPQRIAPASPSASLTINGFSLSMHMLKQAVAKGFAPEDIRAALESPYKITDVTRYPGQKRYCGTGRNGQPGLAVVVDVRKMEAITVYLDGVVTPMRADQRHDAAALRSGRLASIG